MRKRTKIAIATLVAFAAIGGGVAYAVWTATGSGSGAGEALIAQAMTVNPITPSQSGASLYPGGPAGWVYLTITNPNPFPVNVTHINWGTPTSTNPTNCPNSQISLDASAPSTLNVTVPANGVSGTLQIFSVLDLAHTAPDGCQGVAFNVPVTVIGTQS
jgi:hypothetical protein